MNWHCYVPFVFRRGEESSELSLAGCGKTPVAQRGHFVSPWRSMEDPRPTSHCRCVGRKTSAKAADEILQKAVKVCFVCKKPWKKTMEKRHWSKLQQKQHRTLLPQLKIIKNRHQQKIGCFRDSILETCLFSEGWICNIHIIHRCRFPISPWKSFHLKMVLWRKKKMGRQPKMTTWNHKPKIE